MMHKKFSNTRFTVVLSMLVCAGPVDSRNYSGVGTQPQEAVFKRTRIVSEPTLWQPQDMLPVLKPIVSQPTLLQPQYWPVIQPTVSQPPQQPQDQPVIQPIVSQPPQQPQDQPVIQPIVSQPPQQPQDQPVILAQHGNPVQKQGFMDWCKKSIRNALDSANAAASSLLSNFNAMEPSKKTAVKGAAALGFLGMVYAVWNVQAENGRSSD